MAQDHLSPSNSYKSSRTL